MDITNFTCFSRQEPPQMTNFTCVSRQSRALIHA
jgi:hypothetical protein